jgi:hypothetical protein
LRQSFSAPRLLGEILFVIRQCVGAFAAPIVALHGFVAAGGFGALKGLSDARVIEAQHLIVIRMREFVE